MISNAIYSVFKFLLTDISTLHSVILSVIVRDCTGLYYYSTMMYWYEINCGKIKHNFLCKTNKIKQTIAEQIKIIYRLQIS